MSALDAEVEGSALREGDDFLAECRRKFRQSLCREILLALLDAGYDGLGSADSLAELGLRHAPVLAEAGDHGADRG